MTFKNNLRQLGLTLIVALLPIMLYLLFIIDSYNKSGDFSWTNNALGALPYFLGCYLIVIPGLLLHLKYYSLDKDKSIQFKSTYLKITERLTVDKIYYKDIVKVERHSLFWTRIPWDNYGYLKVHTKTGSYYYLTSLLCDHRSSSAYLKLKGVNVDEIDSLFPWII